MKRFGEKATREALANGATIRDNDHYTLEAGYRVRIDGENVGYITSDLFSKLLHDGTIEKTGYGYSWREYAVPAADPEQEQEQQPEPDPVYIDENAPESNSIPNVYYFIEFETGNGQFTVQHYTVDDLTAFISDIKRHDDHRITRAYRVNTATGEKIPFIPETRQERTDRENRAHCQRIAETLEAYAEGKIYRCPECGETFELQTTGYDEETDTYTLPCGCTVDEEPEQLSLYDYFEDVLDIEYRIESDRKTVRSVSLMVAFGGPTIYIDTAENAVMLYWWNDRARYSFDSWIGNEINDWAQELWNC